MKHLIKILKIKNTQIINKQQLNQLEFEYKKLIETLK
jgi:hypothetical protein